MLAYQTPLINRIISYKTNIFYNHNYNDDDNRQLMCGAAALQTLKCCGETPAVSIMIYSRKVRQVMQLHNNCWLLVFQLH